MDGGGAASGKCRQEGDLVVGAHPMEGGRLPRVGDRFLGIVRPGDAGAPPGLGPHGKRAMGNRVTLGPIEVMVP